MPSLRIECRTHLWSQGKTFSQAPPNLKIQFKSNQDLRVEGPQKKNVLVFRGVIRPGLMLLLFSNPLSEEVTLGLEELGVSRLFLIKALPGLLEDSLPLAKRLGLEQPAVLGRRLLSRFKKIILPWLPAPLAHYFGEVPVQTTTTAAENNVPDFPF